MKKSFRGLIGDAEQQQIRLSTNNGLTGYRINKFDIISTAPGTGNHEYVAKVFTTDNDETGSPRASNATVDFDDPTLLAVSYYTDNSSSAGNPPGMIIVFDTTTFNQDIFITIQDATGNAIDCNYYLEVEQVTLSKDEATVATLKDMRAGPDTNFGP